MIKNDRPRDSFGLQLLIKMCRLNGTACRVFLGKLSFTSNLCKKKLEHLERCKKDKIPGKNDEK